MRNKSCNKGNSPYNEVTAKACEDVRNRLGIYTLEECMDEDLGVIGTPIRDAVEKEVREAVDAYQESMRLKTQITTNKQFERCRQIAVHNNKKTEGVFTPTIGWITRVFRSCKIDRNELLNALS